jgi:hypothetical protein
VGGQLQEWQGHEGNQQQSTTSTVNLQHPATVRFQHSQTQPTPLDTPVQGV